MAQQNHLNSPIWKHFSICEDDHSKAVCNVCRERIPRGGSTPKSFNTTNLRKHLRNHPDENKLVAAETTEKERKQAQSSTASTRQVTVAECFERQKPYSVENPPTA